MSWLKGALMAFCAFLGMASFAAEGDGAIDVSVASDALNSLKDTLVSFIGDAAPVLVAIIGAGLGIFLIFWVIRLIKKGVSSAK